jgi:hypothetical protein
MEALVRAVGVFEVERFEVIQTVAAHGTGSMTRRRHERTAVLLG